MASCMWESECKMIHDRLRPTAIASKAEKSVWVPGPIIVGGGPSGLAVAACLKDRGVPSLILERADCVASLWKLRTYDRLCLHLPKQFCELPLRPFPPSFPTYPTKEQFIGYLESYAGEFDVRPAFNETVVSAEYDRVLGFWRVRSVFAAAAADAGREKGEKEYICRWLVVATGENAEELMPAVKGVDEFQGPMIHTSSYRSGEDFRKKRVLVVGCGNSGMEVSLDLCHYNARPSMVVKDSVHVLPKEMFGRSTFGLSMWLLKWLPVRMVDRLLLLASLLTIGDTSKYGIRRPQIGPLELKSLTGKTPVLDVGTLDNIKSGNIKVRPAIKRIMESGAEFVDGRIEEFDAIIFATGYKSNVPYWLKEREFFSEKDGCPRKPFPNGWRGENGLYAVGFTKRGLLGASMDAVRIAQDIEECWKADAKKPMSFSTPSTS